MGGRTTGCRPTARIRIDQQLVGGALACASIAVISKMKKFRNHKAPQPLTTLRPVRVNRTRRHRERGWFFRFPASANELAAEPLSRPLRFRHLLGRNQLLRSTDLSSEFNDLPIHVPAVAYLLEVGSGANFRRRSGCRASKTLPHACKVLGVDHQCALPLSQPPVVKERPARHRPFWP